MTAMVVSPHFDDAVLSAGQFLASHPRAVLATVCSHMRPVPLQEWDRQSGFESTAEAIQVRTSEDDRAAEILHATTLRLGFPDYQYGAPASSRQVAMMIGRNLSGVKVLVGPLGLSHPDHVATSDAILRVRRWWEGEVLLYEELPHRVVSPESVPPRLDELKARGWNLELTFAGDGPRRMKMKAARAYRSQLWALDLGLVLAPERYWRVHPCA